MLKYILAFAWTFSCILVDDNVAQVHLALKPSCSPQGDPPLQNSGLSLSGIKTVYAFGDSWMSNGQKVGGTPPAPIARGSNPKAGGRASDGYVWPEYVAQKLNANIKDYAIGGAVTDLKLWPSRKNKTDMIGHVDTYFSQRRVIDADSTLCLISYGINDYAASSTDGRANLPKAADTILAQIRRLAQSGIRKFIVVSPPSDAPSLRQFDARVMEGAQALKSKGITVAYVELISLFNAIKAKPASFGYDDDITNSCCPSQLTTEGCCKDPGVHLFYVPHHPSTVTHKLISQWILEASGSCS